MGLLGIIGEHYLSLPNRCGEGVPPGLIHVHRLSSTTITNTLLQQALESRNRPNIELLRHSESLHTLRAN